MTSYKINWQLNETVMPEDLNRIESNIKNNNLNATNLKNDMEIEIENINKKIENIDTSADNTTIKDPDNYFESDTVEGALKELAIELHGQRIRGIEIANSLVTKLNTVVKE